MMLRPLLRGYSGQGPLCTLIKHPLDARLGCLGSLPMLFQLPGSLFLFTVLIPALSALSLEDTACSKPPRFSGLGQAPPFGLTQCL